VFALISLLSGLVVALITSWRVARNPAGTQDQRAVPFVGFQAGCLLGGIAAIAWKFLLQ
jgi:hypothetical protein